jgi:hypothetical protein
MYNRVTLESICELACGDSRALSGRVHSSPATRVSMSGALWGGWFATHHWLLALCGHAHGVHVAKLFNICEHSGL